MRFTAVHRYFAVAKTQPATISGRTTSLLQKIFIDPLD